MGKDRGGGGGTTTDGGQARERERDELGERPERESNLERDPRERVTCEKKRRGRLVIL